MSTRSTKTSRFIVVVPEKAAVASVAATSAKAAATVTAPRAARRAASGKPPLDRSVIQGAGLQLIGRSTLDSAALLQGSAASRQALEAANPTAQVFEERWYRLARMGRPVVRPSGQSVLRAAAPGN